MSLSAWHIVNTIQVYGAHSWHISGGCSLIVLVHLVFSETNHPEGLPSWEAKLKYIFKILSKKKKKKNKTQKTALKTILMISENTEIQCTCSKHTMPQIVSDNSRNSIYIQLWKRQMLFTVWT